MFVPVEVTLKLWVMRSLEFVGFDDGAPHAIPHLGRASIGSVEPCALDGVVDSLDSGPCGFLLPLQAAEGWRAQKKPEAIRIGWPPGCAAFRLLQHLNQCKASGQQL